MCGVPASLELLLICGPACWSRSRLHRWGRVAGRGLIEQLDLGTRRLIALRISAHSRIFNAHGQVRPHEEIKLVSCTRGAIFDVAVDVRAGSPSYGKWVGIELSADSRSSVYIPAGFAHGYQTLTDDAEVRYCVSARYHPEAERGVRWDDPDLAIAWPKASQRVISKRDQALPRLRDL